MWWNTELMFGCKYESWLRLQLTHPVHEHISLHFWLRSCQLKTQVWTTRLVSKVQSFKKLYFLNWQHYSRTSADNPGKLTFVQINMTVVLLWFPCSAPVECLKACLSAWTVFELHFREVKPAQNAVDCYHWYPHLVFRTLTGGGGGFDLWSSGTVIVRPEFRASVKVVQMSNSRPRKTLTLK